MNFHILRSGLTLLLTAMLSGITFQGQAQIIAASMKPGTGIYEIVFSEQQHTVYVAAIGTRAERHAYVFCLNPETLAVTDSIGLPDTPPFGLGLNTRTQILYTSNTTTNSVSAIDLKSKKILATIYPEDSNAHTREIVIDEIANKVYITDVGREKSRIWVIDGHTHTLEYFIPLKGKTTTGMALDSEQGLMYVTHINTGEIGVIDLKTRRELRSFPSGGESPTNIVLDPATGRLFVASQKSGDLRVLDAASGSVIQVVETGAGALGINFDPVHQRIFVANRQAGTVTVLHATDYTIIANLKTGTYPNTVAIDKKTGAAYVTNKAQSKKDDPSFTDAHGDLVVKIKF